jgi:hypothetical protein
MCHDVSYWDKRNQIFLALDEKAGTWHNVCMLNRSSKRPRDVNQLAQAVVDQATAEPAPPTEQATAEPPPDGKNPAAVALGRLGGLKGGKARAAKLSKKKRSEIARKAAQARWRRI